MKPSHLISAFILSASILYHSPVAAINCGAVLSPGSSTVLTTDMRCSGAIGLTINGASLDCNNYRILGSSTASIGILLKGGAPVVKRCHIAGFQSSGIRVIGAYQPQLIETTSTLNGRGLHVSSSTVPTRNLRWYNNLHHSKGLPSIYRNRIHGILDQDSERSAYSNLHALENGTSGGEGITLQRAKNTTFWQVITERSGLSGVGNDLFVKDGSNAIVYNICQRKNEARNRSAISFIYNVCPGLPQPTYKKDSTSTITFPNGS